MYIIFFSLFNSLLQLKCSWSSVSPKLSFYSIIEEFLILVFQPAICHYFLVVSKFVSLQELQL